MLQRAWRAGIERVLSVGSDLLSSTSAVTIASQHPGVHAAIGLHPHNAINFRREAKEIETLLDCDKVVAVGEIGLDYYRGDADRKTQIEAFQAQLRWARERGMPVSVHNREADDDILTCLKGSGVTAVLHCFSGRWEYASAALMGNHYLSFAGNLTYPKATFVRQVASRVPLDRVLIETDSPVLAPQTMRGRRNEPSFLPGILETLATARELSAEQVAEQLKANGDHLFHWVAA